MILKKNLIHNQYGAKKIIFYTSDICKLYYVINEIDADVPHDIQIIPKSVSDRDVFINKKK